MMMVKQKLVVLKASYVRQKRTSVESFKRALLLDLLNVFQVNYINIIPPPRPRRSCKAILKACFAPEFMWNNGLSWPTILESMLHPSMLYHWFCILLSIAGSFPEGPAGKFAIRWSSILTGSVALLRICCWAVHRVCLNNTIKTIIYYTHEMPKNTELYLKCKKVCSCFQIALWTHPVVAVPSIFFGRVTFGLAAASYSHLKSLKFERVGHISLILQALAVDDGILSQYCAIIGQFHSHTAVVNGSQAVISGRSQPTRACTQAFVLRAWLPWEVTTFVTLKAPDNFWNLQKKKNSSTCSHCLTHFKSPLEAQWNFSSSMDFLCFY